MLGPPGHAVALFAPGKEGHAPQRFTDAKPLPHDAVLSASADGALVALSRDHIHVFDTATGKAQERMPSHKVHHGAFGCFCPEGLPFTRDPPGSSYFDKRFHVQLLVPKGKRGFEEGRTFELSGAEVPVGLAAGGGRVIGLWQATTGLSHTAVRIWELHSGAALGEQEVPAALRGLSVSADGRVLAAPSWSSVYLFRC